MEKLKTVFLAFLIVLMLLAAGFYIGGSQFAHTGAAESRVAPPAGAVRVGTDAPETRTLLDEALLAPEAVAVSAAGTTAGAFAGDIPDAVTALAYPLIHTALGTGATLSAADLQTVAAAAAGNCILLQLPSALPYQLLYALTGDIDKAAAADRAINADLLLLAFDDGGNGVLYLSDGTSCAVSDKPISLRSGALTALAAIDALVPVTLENNLIPVTAASATVFPISVEDGTAHPLSADAASALLSLFAFNPDRHRLTTLTVVEPHGSLALSNARIAFTASKDGGIPVSDFLESGKDVLDVDIYDILTAAAAFADRLREISPDNFGGIGVPFLKQFYKDGDGYTLIFGLRYDGIEICGDAVRDFLSLTASGGMFTAVTVRRLCVARDGLSLTLFPAAWQYGVAAKNAEPDGLHRLRLLYTVDTLPAAECSAAWYCDRTRFDAADAKAFRMTYFYADDAESEAAQ